VKNDRHFYQPSTPKSPDDNTVDFTRPWKQRQKAKAQKYGEPSRTFIPRVPYNDWLREFNRTSLFNQIILLRPSLSKLELSALMYLSYHQPQRTTISSLARSLGLTLPPIKAGKERLAWAKISPLVKRLARANLVVDIGSEEAQNLAVNPRIGCWDLVELSALRTELENKRRGR
jgi:hypothetical protein